MLRAQPLSAWTVRVCVWRGEGRDRAEARVRRQGQIWRNQSTTSRDVAASRGSCVTVSPQMRRAPLRPQGRRLVWRWGALAGGPVKVSSFGVSLWEGKRGSATPLREERGGCCLRTGWRCRKQDGLGPPEAGQAGGRLHSRLQREGPRHLGFQLLVSRLRGQVSVL